VKYYQARALHCGIALSMLALRPGWSANSPAAQSESNAAAISVAEVPTVTTAPKPPDPNQLAGDSVPKFIAACETRCGHRAAPKVA